MRPANTTLMTSGETSPFHFSTIRKNIFLWVEECERLVTSVCGSRATASKDDTLTRSAVDGF